MVRYNYICNQILRLYRSLPSVQFPIDPRWFFNQIGNCKIMTYNKFAKLNDCTFEEVAAICESDSGCTHYDTVNNRYLVLFNSSSRNHNVVGRIRWTLAHELGVSDEEHRAGEREVRTAGDGAAGIDAFYSVMRRKAAGMPVKLKLTEKPENKLQD